MNGEANTEAPVELVRKFGFKESREDREKRLKDEKQLKWQQKLEKEELGKLQKELEALQRAHFLAPPQRERKRYVEKVVHDLLKQEAKQSDGTVHPEDREDEPVPPPEITRGSDSDSEGEIFGVSIADAFGGTIDAESFVPRSVKTRRVEKPAKKEEPVDAVALAEREILAAYNEGGDVDVDQFLESL